MNPGRITLPVGMMIPPPIPPDEAARLRVLRTYGILETPPEAAFDDVAKLAAQVCDAPIALVTLIDEKREWFKASVGVDLVEATREGFCSYTILGRELLVIPDAHADPRFAENPYVLGPPRVRSYAGAPLITPDGPVIGTLCVLDYVPRIFTPEHGLALVRLARQVQTHLELRRALRIAHEAEGALRAAVLRSIDHEHALIGLTRTCLEAGSLDEAFRVIVRKVSETLQVERVNLWRFNPPRSGIVCVAHYQAGTGT